MDKNAMETILKGDAEALPLSDREKEIALQILKDLDGTLVFRAKSILEFCLKATQYTRIKS